MFGGVNGINGDSFHNMCVNGEWNNKKFKSHFGDSHYQDENLYSPLMTALEISSDPTVIRELLEGGADVNELDRYDRTPLLRYLNLREDCSVDIVNVLLDFKADINRMDVCGDSPLTTVIEKSKDAIIPVLVERGAELNYLRNLHNTPLLLLLREGKYCSVDTVKLFLAYGADVNCVDICGCSPLGTALNQSRDEAVILALLEGGANVNQVCNSGETPLSIYLGNHSLAENACSVGIVQLLLSYKAEVNSINSYGDSPLTIALKNERGEKIIRMLLEERADVNIRNRSFKSTLCIAFSHSSNDIVKLLLDAGSSPTACRYHKSALHCATDYSYSGLREDILKVLLQTNININSVTKYGQSLLCHALHRGSKAHDIQLLLKAGASLYSCERHSSPLICATSGFCAPLREDVVQLLLDKGASVGDNDLKILEPALGCCRYETGAIQLLLDLPGMDSYVVANESLLHLAVQNGYCTLDAVKLLINRNAQVHSKNDDGDNPLHWAMRNTSCDASVINLLLQNGCPINAKNNCDETPLMVAVKEHQSAGILKELLLSGAHIGKSKFRHRSCGFKCELLDFLAENWERCDESKIEDSYRMLLKFFLLQNAESNIRDLQDRAKFHELEKLETFMKKCLSELEKMNSLQVGHRHTFRTFVSTYCLSVGKMFDFNKIMICLMKNTFPAYFDVISARIGRSIMEAEVKRLQVYTSKTHPDMRYGEIIQLNSDVVFKISKYLSDDDLLNFILAFYNPVNQHNSEEASKDDCLVGKRNCEPSSEVDKCPRLYC